VAILEIVGQHLAKAELTAARVLKELRRVAFFDIGELFDARGHLCPRCEHRRAYALV